MYLGKSPVAAHGACKTFDNSLNPVHAGHCLVLFGGSGGIELPAGARTDPIMRRRYPSYALLDLTPQEVWFTHNHRSDDHAFGCDVTMTATVQVAKGVDFVERCGLSAPIGAPLYDHWKTQISRSLNRIGQAGMPAVRKYFTAAEDEIQAAAPVGKGIRLLGCSFNVKIDPKVIIEDMLRNFGTSARAELILKFPEFADHIEKYCKTHLEIRKEHREELEEAFALKLRWLDSLVDRGVYHVDEMRRFVPIDEAGDAMAIKNLVRPTSTTVSAPQKRIESSDSAEEPGP